MTKLSLEIHDDVISTIYKLKNINDSGIELEIPEQSVLFDNILNLKLIQKEAGRFGATINFVTHDENGNNLIQMLEEGRDNINTSLDESEVMQAEKHVTASGTALEEPHSITSRLKKFRFPKLNLTAGPLIKKAIIPLVIVLLIGVGVFTAFDFLTKTQRAVAKITIETQPLTRSFPVKVSANSGVTTENTLKGFILTATMEGSKEIATTGEKLIGEKAKGKIKIYNNTDEERKFKKGTSIVYEDSKDDLIYITADNVTVPAKVLVGPDPEDPANIIYTRGSAEIDVTAEEIGSKYNLDEDKDLSIKGHKESDFEGVVSSEIKGGKSETVKAVAEEDKTKLKNELIQELATSAEKELASKAGISQELIKGSLKNSVVKETYSNETGETAEKIKLTLQVRSDGLAYLKSDLNKTANELVTDQIPQGFELSDKDREIKTEVLGNSANSVLSSTEADLQVTLKTFIVPDINEDQLKNDLAGKKAKEAEKVLGSINNIKGYDLKISPNIPILNSVPKNTEQIEIIVERK